MALTVTNNQEISGKNLRGNIKMTKTALTVTNNQEIWPMQ